MFKVTFNSGSTFTTNVQSYDDVRQRVQDRLGAKQAAAIRDIVLIDPDPEATRQRAIEAWRKCS